ncbi:MAG: hypothetical protein R2705_20475 [Ilumatobacteraceae bacterium]
MATGTEELSVSPVAQVRRPAGRPRFLGQLAAASTVFEAAVLDSAVLHPHRRWSCSYADLCPTAVEL